MDHSESNVRIFCLDSQIGETESFVQDVMVQEVMAVEPVAFKAVVVDIDSIKVQSKCSQFAVSLFKFGIDFEN